MPAEYIETLFVDPADLKPYPGNPNRGNAEVVRGSVRANGQYRSVVARRLLDGSLELLAGHTTTEATGDELGRVRVEVIDADDATARRIVAVDNQAARKATMDEAALLALLDKVNAADGVDGLTGAGFDEVEFRNLVDRQMASAIGKPAPEEFTSYDDETITTEHACPRCGYQWSGSSSAPAGE